MGWFGRKNKREKEETLQKLIQEGVRNTAHEVNKGHEGLQRAMDSRLGELEKYMETVHKQMKRQSEAVEDLLDELQEKGAAIAGYERRMAEKEKREEALVRLIYDYRKKLDLLEERTGLEPAGDDAWREAWRKQFGLVKEQLAVNERLCGIEETGKEGEQVDYRIHQVIRAVDAKEEKAAGTVAKVHGKGMLYEGKVIAKAEVEAYRAEPV